MLKTNIFNSKQIYEFIITKGKIHHLISSNFKNKLEN